jgi:hypothetical protein
MDEFCDTVRHQCDLMIQYTPPEITNLSYFLTEGRWRVDKLCNKVAYRCGLWLDEFSKSGTLNDMYAIELKLKRDGVSLPVQLYLFVAFSVLRKQSKCNQRFEWYLNHANMRWATNCHSSGGVFQMTGEILGEEMDQLEQHACSVHHVSQCRSQIVSQCSLTGQTSQDPSPPLDEGDVGRSLHIQSTYRAESPPRADPPAGMIDVIRDDIDTQHLPEEELLLLDE